MWSRHDGMAKAAALFVQQLCPLILSLVDKHPTYALIVTGASPHPQPRRQTPDLRLDRDRCSDKDCNIYTLHFHILPLVWLFPLRKGNMGAAWGPLGANTRIQRPTLRLDHMLQRPTLRLDRDRVVNGPLPWFVLSLFCNVKMYRFSIPHNLLRRQASKSHLWLESC